MDKIERAARLLHLSLREIRHAEPALWEDLTDVQRADYLRAANNVISDLAEQDKTR